MSKSIQGCITVLQHHYLCIQFYSSPQVVNPELQLTYGTMLQPTSEVRKASGSHLSLLRSGTTCLLSLTKIVQYLNASRTYSATAAGLRFSQPCCACPPTPLPRGTAHCFSFPALNTQSLEPGQIPRWSYTRNYV